jgi:hypothetical protein
MYSDTAEKLTFSAGLPEGVEEDLNKSAPDWRISGK